MPSTNVQQIIYTTQSMRINTAEHPINTAHGLWSEALVLVRRKSVKKIVYKHLPEKNM